MQANIKAADSSGISGAFNIGSGRNITINYLAQIITRNGNSYIKIEHSTERPGDVRHSLADISLAQKSIYYTPEVELEKGLKQYLNWARSIEDYIS